MEDKWLVYSIGPDDEGRVKLFTVRSWTGSRIAEVHILLNKAEKGGKDGKDEKGRGGRITGIVWESSKEVINGQDEKGAKRGVRELCKMYLGVELGNAV